MDAVEYNKSQGYEVETIMKIQRTVGATPDGKWGRQSIAQIKAWQTARKLTADGKVGPATLAIFEAAWASDAAPEDHDLDDGDDTPTPALDDDEGFDYYDRAEDLALGTRGPAVTALQNDLYAFGFEPGIADGSFGASVKVAVEQFQQVCLTPDRIESHQRVERPPASGVAVTGSVDAATRAEIKRWKQQGWRWQDPKHDFMERRVRVAKLGTLASSSALLREVPGTGGKPRLLHRLAAVDLDALIAAAKSDTKVELLIQSGWRAHRWKSYADYEATMIRKYGSVAKGKQYMAYDSPHETGLAVDFGTGGLEAKSATADAQRKTPVYQWLVANAYRFGFMPYAKEPWHWEHPLSLRAWTTGLSDWRLGAE
jgi:peptidoglycan hydrolase-like protein with peptidoglycan-binding domain/D-alanyl-D-alanine dipeptidase